MKQGFAVAILIFFIVVLHSRSAEAYLDPASSSVILQIFVAVIVAVSVTVKAFWHKIRGMFGSGPTETLDHDEKA